VVANRNKLASDPDLQSFFLSSFFVAKIILFAKTFVKKAVFQIRKIFFTNSDTNPDLFSPTANAKKSAIPLSDYQWVERISR
jgi:hypothetical protein